MADLNNLDDSTKTKKDKTNKKSKKELKSPVESQPPLGPLVPLGKPRDKLAKRPRYGYKYVIKMFIWEDNYYVCMYVLSKSDIVINYVLIFVLFFLEI